MKLTARQAVGLVIDATRWFLQWWLAELLELAEVALQVAWPRLATTMRLDLRSRPVRLFRVVRHESALVWENADAHVQQALLDGTLPPPRELGTPTRALEVLVPESSALVREVRLPLAAAARLRAVLELQYNRLMPLKREMVLLDHAVVSTDPTSGQMTVALAALRRDKADPIAALTRLWGFQKVVLVAHVQQATFRFAASTRLASAPDRVERALKVAFVSLAALLLVTGLFGWKLHDLSVQREIAQLQNSAVEVAGIEAELKVRQDVATALEVSMVSPDFVRIISELSKATPEDAWIFQLSRRGYELKIAGEAGQSSLLALRLNESPIFDDVRLEGTTTVAGPNSYGRFEIGLNLIEPPK